jgi:hypothetical protein
MMANTSVSRLKFDADLEQIFLVAGVRIRAAIENLTAAGFFGTSPFDKNANGNRF